MRKLALIILLIMITVTVSADVARNIGWRDLLGYNWETGEVAPEIADLYNKKVSIAGFAYPDGQGARAGTFTTLFLIPTELSCNCIEPPAPNQLIYVFLADAEPLEKLTPGLISITGYLRIIPENSEWGMAGFEMVETTVQKL